MNNSVKILIFISLFAILNIFTGAVSAVNVAINPEDVISPIINNISDNDTALQTENSTDNSIQDELTNTTGIVMSNTTSNCGPASLATVLQNLSINVSQDMLAVDAGTDENGTTIYGLAQAAQKQGLIVKGLKLKVNELKLWNIVYLTIDNRGHYSIVTSISNTMVYLADSDSGNINMTLADFTETYIQNKTSEYGYALVITNNSSNSQLNNDNTLTGNEMNAIKGNGFGVYVYGSNLYAVYVLGWKRENPIIQKLANGIMKAYKPKNITQKAQAIFKFVFKYSVRSWENHKDTQHDPKHVLYYHSANCAETARLVYLLAQDMGIPDYRIRYVHNKIAQHYWVQIHCGKNINDWKWWRDLDCSHAYNWIDTFGEFVEQDGRHGNPMLTGSVREYNVIS